MVWTVDEFEYELNLALKEAKVESTSIDKTLLENVRTLVKKERNPEVALDSQEKIRVQGMLSGLIGNMNTNKAFGVLSSFSASDTGIPGLTAIALKDLSYRTRNLSKIEPDLDRIFSDFKAAREGTKILGESEKISLKQFGILYDLANLNKLMEQYNTLGLIEGNQRLEKLYNQTQQAATMISHLDKSFDTEFRMPTGAVVFDNTKYKAEVYGNGLGVFENIVGSCVTKFGHASKGIATERKGVPENRVSHINPNYVEDKFTLRNFLYSDVYKIKIENLIDKKTQVLLETHLGKDWLVQLQTKYADIEREIHDDSQLHSHIATEGGNKRFAQVATTTLRGGHKNFFINDHRNAAVRDDVFGRGEWKQEGRPDVSKMLCSEFVGKTVIAAVHELNDVAKEMLKAKGIPAREIPDTIIKSPISERETLYLLTPERLLTAMQENGSVEKVGSPAALSKFVSTQSSMKEALREERQVQAMQSEEAKKEDKDEERSDYYPVV